MTKMDNIQIIIVICVQRSESVETRAFILRLSFLTKFGEHKNKLHVENARLYLTTEKHVQVAMELARACKLLEIRKIENEKFIIILILSDF